MDPPIPVTLAQGAALQGFFGCGFLVRIVAQAALAVVGIVSRIELGQHLLHLVAGEALGHSRHQRGCGGIAGREGRDLGGELVAGYAMQGRLSHHPSQLDPGVGMAVRLSAGLVHRREAV
jgi:hypothetical protein